MKYNMEDKSEMIRSGNANEMNTNGNYDIDAQEVGTGKTLFYHACEEGSLDYVIQLVDIVDVNKSDDNGWTPFYIACYYGHLDIVRFLVDIISNTSRFATNRY